MYDHTNIIIYYYEKEVTQRDNEPLHVETDAQQEKRMHRER